MARAPPQSYTAEAPAPSGQGSKPVSWPLKRLRSLPPHLATAFSHLGGIGWEGGIDPVTFGLLYIHAKGQRKSETERLVWTEGFLVEVTCELSHEGWNGIITEQSE